jgi:hypothetical protein
MTVRELIEKLSQFNGELTVAVFDEMEKSYLLIEKGAVDLERSIGGEAVVIYVSEIADEYP